MPISEAVIGEEVVNKDLIGLYDFFGALRKRRLLIVSMSLACALIMTVLAFVMKPVYRGFAVLDPVTSDSNPLTASLMSSSLNALGGSLTAVLGGASEGDRETDEAMTVLGSKEFTERFIQDNHLLPILFPERWDGESGRWKDPNKVPSLALAFVEFDRIRKIDRNQDNDFVTLQIDWPDRVQAAQWTNDMAERLNEELRKRAISSADVSIDYLRNEWAQVPDAATREAISRLIEAQLHRKMLATVTPEFELRFVERAITPDASYPLRPNKPLMISLGAVFGALLGVAASLLLYRRELSLSGRL